MKQTPGQRLLGKRADELVRRINRETGIGTVFLYKNMYSELPITINKSKSRNKSYMSLISYDDKIKIIRWLCDLVDDEKTYDNIMLECMEADGDIVRIDEETVV